MDNVQKVIVQKAFKNQLAHFYIIEPSSSSTTEELNQWPIDLIKNISLNKGTNLSDSQIINHQDILFIKSESKKYNLSDFDSFFSFLNYKATVFDRKYVFIEDAHLLSINLANKLLKSLEEPEIEVCIMLMNANKSSLLDTITSRAIKLRINNSRAESTEKAPDLPSDHIEFSQILKKDSNLELVYQNKLLEAVVDKNLNIEIMNAVQSYFEEYNQDKLYNNPMISRAYKLFNLLNSIT